MVIVADGTYATDKGGGWEYARDLHGGVSNLDMPTVAALLGVTAEKAVAMNGEKGEYEHILNNKCWKRIGETAAIYNHNGNYRLVVSNA